MSPESSADQNAADATGVAAMAIGRSCARIEHQERSDEAREVPLSPDRDRSLVAPHASAWGGAFLRERIPRLAHPPPHLRAGLRGSKNIVSVPHQCARPATSEQESFHS